MNEYKGVRDLDEIERIDYRTITPEEFFYRYINCRCPVILTNFTETGNNNNTSVGNVSTNGEKIKHVDSTVSNTSYNAIISTEFDKPFSLWDNDYLRRLAGEEVVKVEVRDSDSGGRYGKGTEKNIKFSEFLDSIDGKSSCRATDSSSPIDSNLYYLTTQELDYDLEGRPSIVSPPITNLLQDIPLQPSICPTLIVSNINLWYGSSSNYVTSGLHHDYHDNLYLLLRGKKKFSICSPHYYNHMYTVGTVSKIHSNGRINYSKQLTNADGSDLHANTAVLAAEKLLLAAQKLDKRQNENSSSHGNNNYSSDNSADDDENEIDEALEAILDAEMANAADDSDIDDYDEEDDQSANLSNDDNKDNSEDLELEDSLLGKRALDIDQSDAVKSKLQKFLGINRTRPTDAVTVNAKVTPDNFSRIGSRQSIEEINKSYPLFEQVKFLEFELIEGEMLFLPCGWFHEVCSCNLNSKTIGLKSCTTKNGHIALNYWFHPPDNLTYNSVTTIHRIGSKSANNVDSFCHPYTTEFWKKDFEARLLSSSK